jgi:hypothetical protein
VELIERFSILAKLDVNFNVKLLELMYDYKLKLIKSYSLCFSLGFGLDL